MLAVSRDSPLTRCWVGRDAGAWWGVFFIVFVNLKGWFWDALASAGEGV